MKHLKKFLFMKRWRDTNMKEETAPNAGTLVSKKHRLDTAQTIDLEASGEEAPWKVGRYLLEYCIEYPSGIFYCSLGSHIILFFYDYRKYTGEWSSQRRRLVGK